MTTQQPTREQIIQKYRDTIPAGDTALREALAKAKKEAVTEYLLHTKDKT